MSAAKAVRAELLAKRQERVSLVVERERADGEVQGALARRRAIDDELRERGAEIDALEKALGLIDPNNESD